MGDLLRRFRTRRQWLALPPILLGLVVVGVAATNRRLPEQGPPGEVARALRVVAVRREGVVPRVVGYGLAEPARVWRAVAEVDGRVVETHPALDPGSVVAADAALVRIDPTDYELAIGRLEAEAQALEAQRGEVERGRENDAATLEIEKDSLALAGRELARYQQLLRRNAATPAELDTLERDVLAQRRRVRELENALHLVPARLERLAAERAATERRLEAARRDLGRTTIVAPFDGRLASVAIEVGQYVAPGEVLFELHGVDGAEVEARIPLEDLQRLAPPDRSPGDVTPPTAAEIVRGLDATVRVRSGDWAREWPARIVRIRERVDRRTRSLGVVVAVEHPSGGAGVDRPPLLEGTFCEVELEGHPRPDRLLVPRAAVRGGAVFVVDAERRLRRRDVRVRLAVGDDVVVAGDLREGDLVAVSDPSPAVEGMLVDVRDARGGDGPLVAAAPGGEVGR